jgi:hypothetical protein
LHNEDGRVRVRHVTISEATCGLCHERESRCVLIPVCRIATLPLLRRRRIPSAELRAPCNRQVVTGSLHVRPEVRYPSRITARAEKGLQCFHVKNAFKSKSNRNSCAVVEESCSQSPYMKHFFAHGGDGRYGSRAGKPQGPAGTAGESSSTHAHFKRTRPWRSRLCQQVQR